MVGQADQSRLIAAWDTSTLDGFIGQRHFADIVCFEIGAGRECRFGRLVVWAF
jgi:hypothetical protein